MIRRSLAGALVGALLSATIACRQTSTAPNDKTTEAQRVVPPTVPKLVDLTYAFDDKTIYWSAHEKFQHIQVSFGKTPAGYFYSSYNFAGSEHGGTHMDAPIHFS